MNRQTFDALTIQSQIEYINKKLASGITLTKTCKELCIGRATVRKRFNNLNYIYAGEINQYTCDNGKTIASNNKIIGMTGVTTIETRDFDKSSDNDMSLVSDKKVIKNLIGLSDNYDKFMEVIKWFGNDNSKTNAIEIIQGIKIDLPEEKDNTFRKTVRINDIVWKHFNEFCTIHKEFTQKDLLSQSLLDYMEKYK